MRSRNRATAPGRVVGQEAHVHAVAEQASGACPSGRTSRWSPPAADSGWRARSARTSGAAAVTSPRLTACSHRRRRRRDAGRTPKRSRQSLPIAAVAQAAPQHHRRRRTARRSKSASEYRRAHHARVRYPASSRSHVRRVAIRRQVRRDSSTSERCSRCKLRAVQAPGARNRPRSKSITLTVRLRRAKYCARSDPHDPRRLDAGARRRRRWRATRLAEHLDASTALNGFGIRDALRDQVAAIDNPAAPIAGGDRLRHGQAALRQQPSSRHSAKARTRSSPAHT